MERHHQNGQETISLGCLRRWGCEGRKGRWKTLNWLYVGGGVGGGRAASPFNRLGFPVQRGSSLHEKVPQPTVTWARGTGGMQGGKKGVPGSRPLVPTYLLEAMAKQLGSRSPCTLTVWGVTLREGPGRGGLGERTGKETCCHSVNSDANATGCLHSRKPLCWWRPSNHRCVLSTGLIQMEVVKVKTLKCLMETPPRGLCWGECAAQMTTSLCSNRRPTR